MAGADVATMGTIARQNQIAGLKAGEFEPRSQGTPLEQPLHPWMRTHPVAELLQFFA